MKNRLPMFDLFSGIGGFSYALHDKFKTVAYCEKDPFACSILESNMKRGKLDKAQIYPDVRNVTADIFTKHKTVLVTMGFPCQDISGLSTNPAGIEGSRSGLVFDVLENLKSATCVKFLLLENSPNIRVRGLNRLEKALQSIGFRLTWITLSAAQCGAPHKRNRWYGLAYRNVEDLKDFEDVFRASKQWQTEKVSRIIDKPTSRKSLLQRYAVLGNAVVPACVQCAWTLLVHKAIHGKPYKLDITLKKLPIINIVYPEKTHTKLGWSTPVRSYGGTCNKMTIRCSMNLINQVLREKHTYDNLDLHRGIQELIKQYMVNPSWIEWMMGFPVNWTRVLTK